MEEKEKHARTFRNLLLDDFQVEAIECLERNVNTIVSAPTGAGKTLIAEYAVEAAMESGRKVIYTAPIKALSNQKYRDFSARYEGKVGILTGDVSINTEAPLMIMTTEIFRNSIFDTPRRLERVGYVIFDEVHYLDDFERGTVWEEAMISAPEWIRFLCLSATVPNIYEMAKWLEEIRGVETAVVIERRRPVPLKFYFYDAGRVYESLKKWPGPAPRRRGGRRTGRRQPRADEHELIKFIRREGHMPCLYFSLNRARCEKMAERYARFELVGKEERDRLLSEYDDLVGRYGITSRRVVRSMRRLVGRGVAYHHAGLLPSMKEIVERLFSTGLLKLIFTTSTFSLGINMPARSVVIDELVGFDGVSVGPISVRDFFQMAGRAGRRGIDEEGAVYARLDTSRLTKRQVEEIVYGVPEPVVSRFNTCYATMLNLYRTAYERIFDLYERSFHNFLASRRERRLAGKVIRGKMNVLKRLGYVKNGGLTPKGAFAARLYGFELQAAEFIEAGLLDRLRPVDLAVLAMAACYEGKLRNSAFLVHREGWVARAAMKIVRKIRRVEASEGLDRLTPQLNFAMSEFIRMWMEGATLDAVADAAQTDEGELVRYFRRVIQLLRQIRDNVRDDERYEDLVFRINEALDRINRDEVDAEKQLGA